MASKIPMHCYYSKNSGSKYGLKLSHYDLIMALTDSPYANNGSIHDYA